MDSRHVSSLISTHTATGPLARVVLSLGLALAGLAAAPAPRQPAGREHGPAISAEQAIAAALQGEAGANDFRISYMGGDLTFSGGDPVVAYNSHDNEYLVVWRGDDNNGGMVDGEFEIYGQRIDAATGAEIGANDFRISDTGPVGNTLYEAWAPAVAYNSQDNQYLVVWYGVDNIIGWGDDENEIFGQRLEAATGAEIGGDFRISDMGPDGNPFNGAFFPAVAYNSVDNQYLVVWQGMGSIGGLADLEVEIYGQRVDAATGAELGGDTRLSETGPDGNIAYSAGGPAVAYNSHENEYLVVWHGDGNDGGLVDDEFEIFGQRLEGDTGVEIGGDFRISDMGPDGDANYDTYYPAVAYNGEDNQYLVVWYGDDNTGGLVQFEYEIFGQRVDAATGAERGADTRYSDMGGDELYDAFTPAVAYNSQDNEYLVVWWGDDNTSPLVDNEFEIFGQRVDAATGAELGGRLRLTDMGSNGDTAYSAFAPAVAYNSRDNQYLVVWEGDDDSVGDNEFEIFGQHLEADTGAAIGPRFRISKMGDEGNTAYGASAPAVAYNSRDNQYLVVWEGDHNEGGLVNNENEIFGQRLNAATGAEIGGNFRISHMGQISNAAYDASAPAVAYNSVDNHYLVVWSGDHNDGGLVNDEFEIFGLRLNAATGAELAPQFRISRMGPDGNASYGALNPAVAYNSVDNHYLVVWEGDHNDDGLVNDEFEIFGQRLSAATGAAIGDRLRLSDMGPNGNADYDASAPAVAYNSVDNHYLVVWWGDDNIGGLVDEEIEIFGQRVDAATGAEIGGDFRLSDMGPDGNANYQAFEPAVAYNSQGNQYLAVWSGDDNTGGLVDGEFEIFGQRVAGQPRLYLPVVIR